jgi:hypothetical protein
LQRLVLSFPWNFNLVDALEVFERKERYGPFSSQLSLACYLFNHVWMYSVERHPFMAFLMCDMVHRDLFYTIAAQMSHEMAAEKDLPAALIALRKVQNALDSLDKDSDLYKEVHANPKARTRFLQTRLPEHHYELHV